MADTATTTNREPLHRRYLRAADLARLRQLQFAPRHVVEGAYAGRHASPQRGHSVEFSDYREYIPGDEVSDIDWKVYGRSDRLYIKLFEHQTDMNLHLLVDGSASMHFRGMTERADKHADSNDQGNTPQWLSRLANARRPQRASQRDPLITNPSKYDQACLIAGAIGFMTMQQQDKVAFAMARQGMADFHPPMGAMRHLNQILDTMERTTPNGDAQLAEALHAYSRRTRRRSVLVLISDLLEEPEPIMQGLARFAHRGGEVIVFHVLHQDELQLPAWSEAMFVDSESGQRLRLNVSDIRETYQQRVRQTIDQWRNALRARHMDYNLVSTAMPYNQALERYLVHRAGARR